MNPIKVFLSMFAIGIVVTVVAGFIGLYNAHNNAAGEEPVGEVEAASPEELVQQSCISCHGSDLQGGMGGAAPNLLEGNLSKEEIIEILISGRGAMPGGLVSGNEEAVAEYLLSIQ